MQSRIEYFIKANPNTLVFHNRRLFDQQKPATKVTVPLTLKECNDLTDALETNAASNNILYRFSNSKEYDVISNIRPLVVKFGDMFNALQNHPMMQDGSVLNSLKKLKKFMSSNLVEMEDICVTLTPVAYNFTSSKRAKDIPLKSYLQNSCGTGGQIVGFYNHNLSYYSEWDHSVYRSATERGNPHQERDLVLLQTTPTNHVIDINTFASCRSKFIPQVNMDSIITDEPGTLKYFKAGVLLDEREARSQNRGIDPKLLKMISSAYADMGSNVKNTELNFVGDCVAYGVKLDIDISHEGFERIVKRRAVPMQAYVNEFNALKDTAHFRKLDKYTKDIAFSKAKSAHINLLERKFIHNTHTVLTEESIMCTRYVTIEMLKHTNVLSHFYCQYADISGDSPSKHSVNKMCAPL